MRIEPIADKRPSFPCSGHINGLRKSITPRKKLAIIISAHHARRSKLLSYRHSIDIKANLPVRVEARGSIAAPRMAGISENGLAPCTAAEGRPFPPFVD